MRTCNRKARITRSFILWIVIISIPSVARTQESMDKLWGDRVVKLRAQNAERGQLFDEGNYAMFIHWGLYSLLGNEVEGKTYYGIGEWIMNPRMAGIPVEKYKQLAGEFNPTEFDANKIVGIAKDAGMKYTVITAKHHDGFAMYDSKACDFNIVEATPWKKDPMKKLATACREAGLGFGFYYSHNQDWTFPGGNGGPKTDEDGNPATFDDYFQKKCLPQVNEITTEYPYYNPYGGTQLPGQDAVCTVVSHKKSDTTARFTYRENGAEVVRADLIYTLNGGDRYEEWFRGPATLLPESKVSADIPAGTTHYYLNLIDENGFLCSFPEVVPSKQGFCDSAISTKDGRIGSGAKQEKNSDRTTEWFAAKDADKDGRITETEYVMHFTTGFTGKDKNADGLLTRDEHDHASFDFADQDKNNELTAEEFASIFKRQFTRLDKNSDGHLFIGETAK